VLARLVNERGREQFRWVQLAHREAIEPGHLIAGQARQLSSAAVPQPDIHAVRTAFAEEKNSHER
jgi:hypothetical protein